MRRAAVNALSALAQEPHFQDRIDAGVALAAFADDPEAERVLRRLLVDEADTAVIEATAEALLRRNDLDGLRLVVRAYGMADEHVSDHLHDSVRSVLQIYESDLRSALDRCTTMVTDSDSAISDGAMKFLRGFADMPTVLRESAEGLAHRWFSDRGLAVSRSRVDYSTEIGLSPHGRNAPSVDHHMWVDLISRDDGRVLQRGYGSGTSWEEAFERARERYIQEQGE